jgi:hypothetical protein
MGRSLSYDGILAALAVLSTGVVSMGCSKSESARPVEETRATPATTTTDTTAAAAPVLAPTAAASSEPSRAPGASVDAGKEHPTPASAPLPKREAPASCGAQGCSPDMNKGK